MLPAAVPAVIAVPPATVAGGSSPHGVIGGGHAGYNYVLPAFGGIGTAFIVGIEGSIDGSDYRSSTSYFAGNALLNPGSSLSIRADIQGSIRGRLGIAFSQALLYATGGAAFADFRTTTNNLNIGSDTFNHSRLGYTIGGGVEYAVTPQVSVRVEYRYNDFGTFTDYLGNSAAVIGTSIRHRETENIVQAGVSYHFQTPVPVVARY